MFIELRGVEFVNKGAELMLHAIMQEVKKRIPEAQFVMEAGSRTPNEKLISHGIFRKVKFSKLGWNISPLIDIMPKSVKRSKNLVSENEIHAVLDGSGFAFGDKWGAKKAGERSADHIQKWKKAGKKVILLPQAFGPFEKLDLQSKMKTILENADLVFARDVQSYQFLKEIEDLGNLRQSPDFTNLVLGIKPDNKDEFATKIAIVPNQKMMETPDSEKNAQYPSYLAALIQKLQNAGEKPFFLIHESRKDGEIAQKVNDLLQEKLEVVKEENPLKVKGIIGSCKAVVTSRFHGLVSALAQGVPSLSTGWSHKYQELLKDYDYLEGLCEVSLEEEFLKSKSDLILLESKRESTKEKLSLNSSIQKAKSTKMWDEVCEKLQAS